jgi:hypothetical protein
MWPHISVPSSPLGALLLLPLLQQNQRSPLSHRAPQAVILGSRDSLLTACSCIHLHGPRQDRGPQFSFSGSSFDPFFSARAGREVFALGLEAGWPPLHPHAAKAPEAASQWSIATDSSKSCCFLAIPNHRLCCRAACSLFCKPPSSPLQECCFASLSFAGKPLQVSMVFQNVELCPHQIHSGTCPAVT